MPNGADKTYILLRACTFLSESEVVWKNVFFGGTACWGNWVHCRAHECPSYSLNWELSREHISHQDTSRFGYPCLWERNPNQPPFWVTGMDCFPFFSPSLIPFSLPLFLSFVLMHLCTLSTYHSGVEVDWSWMMSNPQGELGGHNARATNVHKATNWQKTRIHGIH